MGGIDGLPKVTTGDVGQVQIDQTQLEPQQEQASSEIVYPDAPQQATVDDKHVKVPEPGKGAATQPALQLATQLRNLVNLRQGGGTQNIAEGFGRLTNDWPGVAEEIAALPEGPQRRGVEVLYYLARQELVANDFGSGYGHMTLRDGNLPIPESMKPPGEAAMQLGRQLASLEATAGSISGLRDAWGEAGQKLQAMVPTLRQAIVDASVSPEERAGLQLYFNNVVEQLARTEIGSNGPKVVDRPGTLRFPSPW